MVSSRSLGAFAIALSLGAWPMSADATELRFSQTAAGIVVATGNTLGLSKQASANGPGIEDSIGTFVSLDPTAVDTVPANAGNPWFGGTTNDWTMNGSDATLTLPPDAEVLYAELVWGGSFSYGTEDVTASLGTPVTLAFGNDTQQVAPDPLTAETFNETAFTGFPVRYYLRSADVTAFVAAHESGTYSVRGVPATQDTAINSLNAAGWTLVVAYRDTAEPIRNLTIFVGGSFVDEDTTEDYDFNGFCTPPSGPFTGRAVVSAIEGDADLVGDSLAIAETAAGPFVRLSGANNPEQNFFCSQINDPNGDLDMSGTFGDRNQDAFAGINMAGGRQGWDVTSIAVGSDDGHFVNGQTSAVLRTETSGDSYVPAMVAFAIAVNAPSFADDGTGATANPDLLALDATSTIAVTLHNAGFVTATDLVFLAAVPGGLVLDGFTLDGDPNDADGNPVDEAALEAGIPIGDVAPGQTVSIEIIVRAVAPPGAGATSWVIVPQWTYQYVSCVGEPPLSEPHATAPVILDFEPSAGTSGGVDDGEVLDDTAGDSASASASDGGDTSGSASADDSPPPDPTDTDGPDTDSAGATEDSGCGCRSDRTPTGTLAWLVLGVLTLRRRRVD